MSLPLQPNWKVLFVSTIKSEEGDYVFHNEFYIPLQPYPGLVIHHKGISLTVKNVAWDVEAKKFIVDYGVHDINSNELHPHNGLLQKCGWRLHSKPPGVQWEE